MFWLPHVQRAARLSCPKHVKKIVQEQISWPAIVTPTRPVRMKSDAER